MGQTGFLFRESFRSLWQRGQLAACLWGYELTLNSNGDNDIVFDSGSCLFTTRNANGRWINNHLGEWIHLAITVDAKTKTRCTYVNGQATGDEYEWAEDGHTLGDALMPVTNDLYLGRPDPQHHGNRSGFDGLMDEC